MILLIGLALAETTHTIENEGQLFTAQTNSNDGDTYRFTWTAIPEGLSGIGLWIRDKELIIEGETTETPLPPLYLERSIGSEIRSGVMSTSATMFMETTEFTTLPRETALHLAYSGVLVDDLMFREVDAAHAVWSIDTNLEIEDTDFEDNSVDSELVYVECEDGPSTCRAHFTSVEMQGDKTYAGVRVDALDGTSPNIAVYGASVFTTLGGGVVVSGGSGDVEIHDALFVDNFTGSPGAAVYLSGAHAVELRDVEGTGGNTSQQGGFLYMDGGVLDASGLKLEGNVSGGDGAAMVLSGLGSGSSIHRSRFCGSVSGAGGDLYVSSSVLSITNSVFQANNGPAALRSKSSLLQVENVSFVGNAQTAIDVSGGDLDVVNVLLDGNAVGVATDPGVSLGRIAYNLWYGNGEHFVSEGGDTMGVGNIVDHQPLYVDGYASTDCSTDPAPADGSPVVDNGDPDQTDSFDGSRSDIGAFGGSGSETIDPAEPGDTISSDTGSVDTGLSSGSGVDDTGAPGASTVWLSGGCKGGLAALFAALGLGLTRRGSRRPTPGRAGSRR